MIVCNFTPVRGMGTGPERPGPGFWKEVLNSDAAEYGGSDVGNLGGKETEEIPCHGRPWSLDLTLPLWRWCSSKRRKGHRESSGRGAFFCVHLGNREPHGHRERKRDATSPAMRESARPWKIGSKRITPAPTTTAACGEHHGRNRTAPASTTLPLRHSLLEPEFDEVHEDNRVAHHNPGSGNESDHGRGGEKAPIRAWAGRMPTREKGMAAMMVTGVLKTETSPPPGCRSRPATAANARPRSRNTP